LNNFLKFVLLFCHNLTEFEPGKKYTGLAFVASHTCTFCPLFINVHRPYDWTHFAKLKIECAKVGKYSARTRITKTMFVKDQVLKSNPHLCINEMKTIFYYA